MYIYICINTTYNNNQFNITTTIDIKQINYTINNRWTSKTLQKSAAVQTINNIKNNKNNQRKICYVYSVIYSS